MVYTKRLRLADFGLIFDFDGTICLSESVHMDAWVVIARKLGLPLPDGFVEDGVGVADAALAKNLAILWGAKVTPAQILRLKCEEFRGRNAAEFPLVPGVIKFMDQMKHQEISMALATSSALADIKPVFSTWSMDSYFKAVFTIESVLQAKPDPEVYLKASASIGCRPEQVFVFEDSLPGVTAARAAGCQVIGVGTTYSRRELDPLSDYILDFGNGAEILTMLGL